MPPQAAQPAAVHQLLASEEHEMFRESVRAFARERLASGYLQRAESEEFPAEQLLMLGAQGLLGLMVSPEQGGEGPDDIATGIACEELAWADFNACYLVFAAALTGRLLEDHCAAAGRWLSGMLRGETFIALALTEPGVGSDAAALTTRAERVQGGWRLTGEKSSITGATHAAAAVTFARTGEEGARGVTAFLVPIDDSVGRQRFRDSGFRPLGRGALSFDGTFVPDDHVVGEVGRGLNLVLHEFDFTRVLIGLMAVGAAQRALDLTIAYTSERRTFGQPVARYQGVSFTVAEHATMLEAARRLCYHALALRAAGRRHTKEAAMVKWWVPRLAFDAIQDCIVLHGHVGWSDELPLQQLLRDVSGMQIGDGTPQIQKLVIARQLYGRELLDGPPARHNPTTVEGVR
jgi:cyclohexanecarboxyl-CoA dehydrogenase